MNRREVLRILGTGAALQLAPHKLLAVMREARALLASQGSTRTFNAHQDATVKAMAEAILPRTETPGASDVGTSAFIDLILTEWCEEPERTRFLHGLAEVDNRAKALFGNDFVDCSSAQQSDILIELGEKMVANVQRLHDETMANADFGTDFYPMFRRLTLTAYYTSEAGATQELHFEIIPDRYQGCDSTGIKEVSERR